MNPLDLSNHVVYRKGGALVNDGNVKLFSGRTTRVYTNLRWERASLGYLWLDENDDDYDGGPSGGYGLGFTDYDNGQTRVGIDVDANKHVYLLVKLGRNSTGVNFEEFEVIQTTVYRNRMVDFDHAPPGGYDEEYDDPYSGADEGEI